VAIMYTHAPPNSMCQSCILKRLDTGPLKFLVLGARRSHGTGRFCLSAESQRAKRALFRPVPRTLLPASATLFKELRSDSQLPSPPASLEYLAKFGTKKRPSHSQTCKFPEYGIRGLEGDFSGIGGAHLGSGRYTCLATN
jgi:hypothetical protein